MAMEKEALTHRIEDDLARRNRNWDKIDTHMAEFANLIKTKNVSGTTNSNGNLPASIVNLNVNEVVIIGVVGTGNYVSIPYTAEGGSKWGVKCMNNTSFTNIADTQVNLTIYYIDR